MSIAKRRISVGFARTLAKFVILRGFSPEESLPESLVALFGDSKRKSLVYKRDSSVVSLPQNDNESSIYS
ncbi:hypothetical protein [Helicobacter marmotae]|uniref:hypothetical protein n=1 Tax=Helicobacter marmotae TaxID=152490 RepID=UPI0011C05A68|nr:hypothetical protein [Helicobacter marmotae]